MPGMYAVAMMACMHIQAESGKCFGFPVIGEFLATVDTLGSLRIFVARRFTCLLAKYE
jgi:hypothetical protein